MRLKLLLGSRAPTDHINASESQQYQPCVRSATGVDQPKYLKQTAQAVHFQMALHVEGQGGWADRLKALLLSGAVVLKQAIGSCTVCDRNRVCDRNVTVMCDRNVTEI